MTIISDYEHMALAIANIWHRLPADKRRDELLTGNPFIPGGLVDLSGLFWAMMTLNEAADPETLEKMKKSLTAAAVQQKRSNSEHAINIMRKFADAYVASIKCKFTNEEGFRDRKLLAASVAREIAPLVQAELKSEAQGRKHPHYTAETIAKKLRTIGWR
jgi:hypothetical protein